MPTNYPKGTYSNLIDDTLKEERNYHTSIQKQINQEELKFKAALKADQTFEVLKEIRVRIKTLQSFLNMKNMSKNSE